MGKTTFSSTGDRRISEPSTVGLLGCELHPGCEGKTVDDRSDSRAPGDPGSPLENGFMEPKYCAFWL